MITRTRLLKGAQKIEFPQGVGITMPRLRNFHFTGDRYKGQGSRFEGGDTDLLHDWICKYSLYLRILHCFCLHMNYSMLETSQVQVSYALSYSFTKNWIVRLLMSNPSQMCDLVLCIYLHLLDPLELHPILFSLLAVHLSLALCLLLLNHNTPTAQVLFLLALLSIELL